jgi:hypothetical protein
LKLTLDGVCGTNETYWVHVPSGYDMRGVKCAGLTAVPGDAQSDARGGQALAIRVDFPTSDQDRTRGTLTVLFTTAEPSDEERR